MGNPEAPRHLTGEEINQALEHGIESGQIVLPPEDGPAYTTEEVTAELGIEWPPAELKE